MATLADLRSWLNAVRRFHSDSIDVVSESENTISARLYTGEHRYTINARNALDGVRRADGSPDAGYVGCTASCRKPYAGEEHTRGRDLADGPLSLDTWNRILADIVAYEIMPIFRAPTTRPVPVAEIA